MTPDEFWSIVESARAATRPGESLADAVVGLLVEMSPEVVLDFEEHFQDAASRLHRWDVWAAAYLIGGGCSDDHFMDFRAGVVGLGRAWYERVTRDPDVLAEYEPVRRAAGAHDDVIFDERLLYSARSAYERLSGDSEQFHEADASRRAALSSQGPVDDAMGEQFDFDSREEMRQRLPRLVALYERPASPAPTPGNATGTPRTVEIRRVRYEAGEPVETVEHHVQVSDSGELSPDDLRAIIEAMKPQSPPSQ